MGFLDSDFFASDDSTLSPRSGFFQGQLVFHFISPLSSRLNFFTELAFTARRDASTTASAPGFNPEVERAILKYSVSDYLTLSVGRWHTPFNYWNITYHHGNWLQTTVSRPDMIQFARAEGDRPGGGLFLPIHTVGLLVEGAAPLANGSFDYHAGVGNGRATVLSRAGDAGDVNNNRSWIVSLGFQPHWLYSLKFGGAIYGDLVTIDTSDTRELITSGYLVWLREDPEFLGEYLNVRHRSLRTDRVTNSHAYYLQAAYRLPGALKRWKPYYRWEEIRINPNDEVFSSRVNGRRGSIVGVRFDFVDLAAIKAEYRRQQKPGAPYANAVFAQVCFTF